MSPAEFASQLRAIRADLDALLADLTPAQFNWQPDGGRKWSVGQCIDHLARTNAQYDAALADAVARARPRAERTPGVPNRLGRWFIRHLEPPVTLRVPAPASLRPPVVLDPIAVRKDFDASVDALSSTLDRAWTIDLTRARFRNPLLGGLPVFNVATGFLVTLAHMRRHVAQANAAKRAYPSNTRIA
jgi:hypothetical protein